MYGGPSVPTRYQSLSSTFSGASPFLDKHTLSSGLDESNIGTINLEQIYMMSGNIPNLDPQGSNLQPQGQPQGSNLQPQGQLEGQCMP